jgi:ribosomal protein S18 acetylase RimI-like enzyme
MANEDLQVGDIWTDMERRGLGLATYGLERAVEVAGDRPRKLWYIVEENNVPSIRLVEKVGFACVARGIRTKRLGLSILGAFEVEGSIEADATSGNLYETRSHQS